MKSTFLSGRFIISSLTSVAAVVLIIGFALVSGLHAQEGATNWTRFLPPLTDGDMEKIQQLVRVEMQGQEPGKHLTWENSESGNSGLVVLMGRSQIKDMNCMTNKHMLKMAGESYVREYQVMSCQLPDGTWKWSF